MPSVLYARLRDEGDGRKRKLPQRKEMKSHERVRNVRTNSAANANRVASAVERQRESIRKGKNYEKYTARWAGIFSPIVKVSHTCIPDYEFYSSPLCDKEKSQLYYGAGAKRWQTRRDAWV